MYDGSVGFFQQGFIKEDEALYCIVLSCCDGGVRFEYHTALLDYLSQEIYLKHLFIYK